MGAKAWAREYEPVLAVIASFLAIVAVAWAAIQFIFAPPTLAIEVQTNDLQMPWSVYKKMDEAIGRDSATISDSAKAALTTARDFLRDTENFTQISLTNSSSASLSNVDIRVHYVRDLDGWAIEGDALDGDERQRLLEAIRFDAANALVTLRGISRMPPKSTLKLYLWGNVSQFSLLGDERVSATYDGGAGEMVSQRTVRGFDAFVYDNAGLLVVTLLLFNVAFWNAILLKKVPHNAVLPGANTPNTATPPVDQ